MRLDPETTDRLVGMVSSSDKEDRIVAYAMIREMFTHIMFSVRKNIGYLLVIYKHTRHADFDDNNEDLKKIYSVIVSNTYMVEKYPTWTTTIAQVRRYTDASDINQRKTVYRYACNDMRKELQLKDE